MSNPRVKSRRLSCTAVDFVEVDFPKVVTPRLDLQFSHGISILLEKPDDIAFTSELVAATPARIAAGRRDATEEVA